MLEPNGLLAGMRARVRRGKSLLLPFVTASVCLIGAGCSSGTSTATQFAAYGMNAYVPAPGTSLQNSEVSMFVGSTYLAANMSFGQLGSSGNPVSLPAGTFNVYASLFQANTVLAQANSVTFNGNNSPYTIITAGQSGQTGALAPQVIVMPNYTNGALSLAAGQCAIRVINVSLNPHPVGLYATTGGNPTATIAAATSAVSFGYGAGTNPYTAVTNTSLVNMAIVDSTATGVALPITNSNIVSNLNSTGFVAGNAYTLVIYGQPGNTSTYDQLGATWIQDYPLP